MDGLDRIERHRVDLSTPAGKAAWLALRAQDVTASDIGALAGVDRYKTPAQVWAEKQGLLATEESAAMRRGRWLEAANFEAVRETFPDWEVRRANVYARHPDLRMGCTPDFVAIDPERSGFGIVQAKNVAKPIFDEWQGVPPLSYALQTVVEAMLTGASWGDLSVIVTSTYTADLHRFEIPLHAGAWAKACAIVQKFWTDFAAGVMPTLDYERDGGVLEALYPAGNAVDAPADLTGNNALPALCAERDALSATVREARERIDAIDNEIKGALGDHVVAYTSDGRSISHRPQHRASYVVEAKTFRRLYVGKPNPRFARRPAPTSPDMPSGGF